MWEKEGAARREGGKTMNHRNHRNEPGRGMTRKVQVTR